MPTPYVRAFVRSGTPDSDLAGNFQKTDDNRDNLGSGLIQE